MSLKRWKVVRGVDFSFKCENVILDRIAYEVYSCVSSDILPVGDLSVYLQVPESLKKPLKEFLQKHKIHGSADEIAIKLKSVLGSPPFMYSKDIGPLKKGLDPVIQFLFITHKGWCEHFASATVLLLRTAGVPARLVGGYCGGVWNESGGYYIVRQNDAHSWVEYFDGNRWRTIDPTPPAYLKKEKGKIGFLTKWIDSLRLKWYLYVINYDYFMQISFLRSIKSRFSIPKMSKVSIPNYFVELKRFKVVAIWLFGIFFLVVFLFLYRSRTSVALNLRNLLKRYGFDIKESQGLIEIAERIKNQDRILSDMILRFAYNWYEIRFGEGVLDMRRVKEIYREIKSYLRRKGSSKRSFLLK